MTTPKPHEVAAAAAAYIDKSWTSAPLDDLFAGFKSALEAKDWLRAQQQLHWLQARLTAARDDIEIPSALSRP